MNRREFLTGCATLATFAAIPFKGEADETMVGRYALIMKKGTLRPEIQDVYDLEWKIWTVKQGEFKQTGVWKPIGEARLAA